MRLGQLARKLEVRPLEIINFLANNKISIENSTNARLDADHVALVTQHFSPTSFSRHDADTIETTNTVPDNTNTTVSQIATPDSLEMANEAAFSEQNEVIKAPKIELSGLKVLGKIELPEIKKKEPDKSLEKSESDAVNDQKAEKRNQTIKRRQQPTKNPIALQREREALEAKKKREEEIKQQKERRTENYLRKVKAHQPTKAARVLRAETEELSSAELVVQPKTWWGKFVKWLTT
jgi:hypothetical protein